MLELSRAEILDRFRKSLAEGNILLGVGAGTGITAKSAEAGGADIFVIYNSGRFRMAGRGSLAGLLSYGDANQIVVEMGSEVLPVVKDTPVLAGVCGTDPFRVMSRFLKELKDQGFPAFMTVKDGLFYVRAGAFREIDNAVQMERRLRRLGYGTLITRS